MKIKKVYEDKNLTLFWKPNGMPTLRWFVDPCVLSQIVIDYHYMVEKKLDKIDEWWLLNRLDNDTWGLVYFAWNKRFFNKYKKLQLQWKVEKFYIAEVVGKVEFFEKELDYPIMHHKGDKKMVTLTKKYDQKKWRWKIHNRITYIQVQKYDSKTDTTTLKVKIHRWIRHQIRVHLATLWYPIIWDKLYWWKENNILHLWSTWLVIYDEKKKFEFYSEII